MMIEISKLIEKLCSKSKKLEYKLDDAKTTLSMLRNDANDVYRDTIALKRLIEEARQKKTEPTNYLDVDIYYSDDYLKCSHCARFVTVEQEFRDAFRRGNYEELLQEIVNTHISNCHGCGND